MRHVMWRAQSQITCGGVRSIVDIGAGAATSIYLASSPEVEGRTGKYYIDCKPAVANWKVYVPSTRERFWGLSCELTGEEFDVAALTSADAFKRATALTV